VRHLRALAKARHYDLRAGTLRGRQLYARGHVLRAVIAAAAKVSPYSVSRQAAIKSGWWKVYVQMDAG
jgi:hypothetical protein